MRRLGWILVLVAGTLAACGQAEPDIDVALALDLGTLVKGGTAVAELPLRNLGEGPLTLFAVSTSCGCTKASVSSMTVPPGGEVRLRIAYDSGAHEDDLGPIERSVFVASDDPDEGDVEIRIGVFVEAAGRSSPGA